MPSYGHASISTPAEVEKLTKATRTSRYGHRDATLILIAYRHGLRAIEIATWNGHRSNSAERRRFTSGAPRTANRPLIPFVAMRSAPYGN